MRSVADENVDSAVVTALRNSGHGVWYVAEEATAIEDDELLEKAVRESALLLTSDKDFGDLVFRQGKASAGAHLLRLAGVGGRDKATIVTKAVTDHEEELLGAFSVLTQTALRVRRRGRPG